MFNYFLFRVLKRPLRLAITHDRKVKNPQYTIIFLHGIAATSQTWRPTFNQFIREPELASCRLITLDLLGFGHSLQADWLHYDYPEYRSALHETIKKLRIKTPIILVGHSMGSLIAADYSIHYHGQLAAQILVSPPILLPEELQKMPDKFYKKSYRSLHRIAEEPGVQAIAKFISKVSSFNNKYLNSIAFAYAMENVILDGHVYDNFLKIKTPTTLIHGRFDPLVFKPNLVSAAKANSNLKLFTTNSNHDIDKLKRGRILNILKETIKDETL